MPHPLDMSQLPGPRRVRHRPSRRTIVLSIVGGLIALTMLAVALDPGRGRPLQGYPSAPTQPSADAALVSRSLHAVEMMRQAGAITKMDCLNHEVFLEPAFWRMAKYDVKRDIVAGIALTCEAATGYRQVNLRDAYSGKTLGGYSPLGSLTIEE